MKAVVCPQFGPPEVLQIRDVPAPVPRSSEVLIRVRAVDVNPSDCAGRSGFAGAPLWMRLIVRTMFRFVTRHRILGIVLAGDIEECGSRVTQLEKGTRVIAFTGARGGCDAEYACVRANGIIAPIPDSFSYVDAASIVYGGLIASACLRRVELRPGDSIVIYGASGAVGSAAVQLAVEKGAIVTGISSAANTPLVKSLGAHTALAYDSDDQPGSEGYKFMFDAAGKRKKSNLKEACRRAIFPEGKFISVDTLGLKLRRDDMMILAELLESGRFKPVIDRIYSLDEIVEAHRRVETRHKRGSVVVTVSDQNTSV